MAGLRIGMVLADRESLPDIRIDKEAAALVAAGYDVGLLAPGRPAGDLGAPAPAGVQVERAAAPFLSVAALSPRPKPRLLWSAVRAGRLPVLWARAAGIEGVRFARAAVSEPWRREVVRFIDRFRPDVLHAHDLIVLPTVLAAAGRRPVVADLHEDWPAFLACEAWAMGGARGWAFGRFWDPVRWRRIEAEAVAHCAAVLVVAPEAVERIAAAGVPRDRIAVVSNTTDVASLPEGAPLEGFDDRFVLLYAGSVGPERGLDVVVRALPMVVASHPHVLLLVVGANDAQRRALTELASELGVRANVDVRGWVPMAEIPRYVATAAAGLVPHLNLEHPRTMVPHKLFQYMALGKPVIASDCGPLRRILADTSAGLTFAAGSPAAAAAAIVRLAGDPDLAAQLAANGHRAARGSYAWRHDAARLTAMYERIAASLAVGTT